MVRAFEVDPFLADGSGDDLYGMDAPVADSDGVPSAPAGGKQGGVPAQEPFFREWRCVVEGGVGGDEDDAFDGVVAGGHALREYA